MAEASNIEWTDSTFNPWTGCTKVSPGCDHCYAEGWSKRAGAKVGKWGPGAPRVRTKAKNWSQPAKWNKRNFFECAGCGWRGDDSQLDERSARCPRCVHHSLQAARRRVFCASLADVFDNEVPDEWRADLFRLIADTPNLDWLLLTKRIGNVMPMVAKAQAAITAWNRGGDQRLFAWPLPNVWLGATIVNQDEAERDIPKLLATPAHVRFLSMEPLLGPTDLTCIDIDGHSEIYPLKGTTGCEDDDGEPAPDIPAIDWVIVGGESGHNARPTRASWARSLRDQCAAAGVPFLFKQWGEFLPADANEADPTVADVPDSRLYWSDGSMWDRFDGQRAGVELVARVGTAAAGRLLDGREHNGYPVKGDLAINPCQPR